MGGSGLRAPREQLVEAFRRPDAQTNPAAAGCGADSPIGTSQFSFITPLDAPGPFGGGKFSAGQRQLLALADLLGRSKVLNG